MSIAFLHALMMDRVINADSTKRILSWAELPLETETSNVWFEASASTVATTLLFNDAEIRNETLQS